MRAFGEILAENRKKKGYSQSDLVELLSREGIQVTTKAVSKWETNSREPSLHIFLTLCQLLDIEDIYEAFFGENPYNIMSGLNEEGKKKLIEFADILRASKMFSCPSKNPSVQAFCRNLLGAGFRWYWKLSGRFCKRNLRCGTSRSGSDRLRCTNLR